MPSEKTPIDRLRRRDENAAASTLQHALRRRLSSASQHPLTTALDAPFPVATMQQDSEEEISSEFAEYLLTHAQHVSSAFSGLSEDAIRVLAHKLSIIRFSAHETIMVEGEAGTWFGILLAGDLGAQLPNGQLVRIPEGSILGEMAIWNKGGKRANSVVALAQPGIIAVMLVNDLRVLANEHPSTGCQLMQLVGRSALMKQLDNV